MVGAVEGDADVLGQTVGLQDGEPRRGEELRDLQRQRRTARRCHAQTPAEIVLHALKDGQRVRLVVQKHFGGHHLARLTQTHDAPPRLERLLKTLPLLFGFTCEVGHDARVNLLEEARQTGKDCRPHLDHVLTEPCQVVYEVGGCARVETVVETRDALGHVTVGQVGEGDVRVEDRHRLAQRFDAVDDVAMAQARALRQPRRPGGVDHDGRVVGLPPSARSRSSEVVSSLLSSPSCRNSSKLTTPSRPRAASASRTMSFLTLGNSSRTLKTFSSCAAVSTTTNSASEWSTM